MKNFKLKSIENTDILTELNQIGFDKGYAPYAADKYRYRNIKIFGLNAAQANILKQTALTVGADCATPRGTITGNIESADCILGGTISQISKIAVKLGVQPFGLRSLGRQLEEFIKSQEGNRQSPRIMGILNLTKNSFSDGGLYYDYDNAIARLEEIIKEGADIIDIGAESTKPYSEPITEEDQLKKLLPILEYISNKKYDIPISIDTRSSEVAKQCLNAGATAINDVSGLTYDKNMASTVADYGCPVIIQHTKGTPDIMQLNPEYTNLMDEIFLDLKEKIDYAIKAGINKENIIIDPGIGFGKQREHNFEILRRIGELKSFGCPIMLGLSRKSMLNMPDADNETKDIFSAALAAIALENGVDILRVHNVKLHKTLLEVLNS
jgi:dihydropteroate synthase